MTNYYSSKLYPVKKRVGKLLIVRVIVQKIYGDYKDFTFIMLCTILGTHAQL